METQTLEQMRATEFALRLAEARELGSLRGLLDYLTEVVADNNDAEIAHWAKYVVNRYRQFQLEEANEGVQDPATVPFTPAEEDEMERVEEARRKTGRTPHEL